jgi:DNA-directed RNA polymerase subunit RPC12/RpoP
MNEKTLDNRCPSCGAPIFFNPTLGKWKCDYCDSVFSLEQLQMHNNASSKSANEETTVKEKKDNYITYLCKDCGAEIVADEQTSATFCVYCGNTAILKNKLSGEFRPAKIIPFKTEKKSAINSFKGLSKGRPLMPKKFNNEKNIEKITGVYIPFWLFDINVDGSLAANAQKISTWVIGNTHFTKTDNYKLYRSATMDYLKIPVDGSTRFDNDIMNTIEPFDYKELEDYNHAYLSGFLAEKYDVVSEKAIVDANERALNSTVEDMKRDMGNYQNKNIFENNLVAKEIKAEYALLPVWMVNVKYNNKFYTFAMNGQTGEFIGNIPLDKKKTLIYSVLMFSIVFSLVILLSYVFHIIGKA